MRLPCRDWLKTYNLQTLGSDLVAAVIVTIMLISDEVSNDGKHFSRAIEQISELKTKHKKDRAYIANFLCECMD